MKIIIECDCGNIVALSVRSKKYVQLRDGLESRNFRYDGEEISDGRLKEIRIKCDECKRWFTLGVD